MTCKNSIPLGSPHTAVNTAVEIGAAAYKLTADRSVAVDTRNEWQSMVTCPLGVKVQLLNPGGVAVYGKVSAKDRSSWLGWHPLPRRPRKQSDQP